MALLIMPPKRRQAEDQDQALPFPPVTEAGWPVVGMTADEAADALRVDRKTLLLAIRDDGLPARKVGKGWRIDPEALRRWISSSDADDTASDGAASQRGNEDFEEQPFDN